MRSTSARLDHTFAKLEDAADHAHMSSYAKAHVGEAARAKLVAALGSCVKADIDLERFLASAAARAKGREVHCALYLAAEQIGELPHGLAEALHSIDARVDGDGTVRGTFHRVSFDAKHVVLPDDQLLLGDVEKEFLHAIAVYDEALESLAKTPGAFVTLVEDQRKMLSHLHRALEELHTVP